MPDFIELITGNSLTRLVFFPILACIPLFWARSDASDASDSSGLAVRWYLLAVSMVELGFGMVLLKGHLEPRGTLGPIRDLAADGTIVRWMPSLGVSFDLGLNGVSLPLVVLTLLLFPVMILGSWTSLRRRWPLFGVLLLTAVAGILGVLLSLDLFLFFVFWQAVTIPIALLFRIWADESRKASASRFILLSALGDLPLLLAIMRLAWIHFQMQGDWSFSITAFVQLDLPPGTETWFFAAFAFAFAIRVALFPLHFQLADLHTQVPISFSILISCLYLSLGANAFLRCALPLFPAASLAARPYLIALALAGMLFGALRALGQKDLRAVIAYGSISQLGFVMLGIFSLDRLAWQGATMHLLHHGLSIGVLFLLAGMLHERRATWNLEELGGAPGSMPFFGLSLVVCVLALSGMPMLSGFAGQLLVLSASFRSLAFDLPWAIPLAMVSLPLTAVYLARVLSSILAGPSEETMDRGMQDLRPRELLVIAPLLALMLVLGFVPELLLKQTRGAVYQLNQEFHESLDVGPAIDLRSERARKLSIGNTP